MRNFTEWDHPISRKRDHFGASVGSYAFERLVSTVFFLISPVAGAVELDRDSGGL
jgi:hypothetical protein